VHEGKAKVKGKAVPVLYQVPHQEDIWGSTDTASHVLTLGTR